MVVPVVRVLIFIAVSLTAHGCLGSSVKIDVTTQYHDGVIPNAFNIRCIPQAQGNCARNIISVQVTKDDDKIIANIKGGDTISYNRVLQSSVTAEGHIDDDPSKTYLSVTVNDAVKEDSGLYKCKLFYLDSSLQFQIVTDGTNVTITNQDTQDIIKHLMSKISFLENLVKFQQDELSNVKTALVDQLTELQDVKITLGDHGTRLHSHAVKMDRTNSTIVEDLLELQDATKAQAHKLDEFIAKDNTTVSFVALRPKAGVFEVQKDVVFSNVILNIGSGYDGVTGKFTAPVTGFYMLSVSMVAFPGKTIVVDLRSDDGQTLARLRAADKSWAGHSDTSCVVKLEAGERVRPVARWLSSGFHLYFYDDQEYMNRFFGHLLKKL